MSSTGDIAFDGSNNFNAGKIIALNGFTGDLLAALQAASANATGTNSTLEDADSMLCTWSWGFTVPICDFYGADTTTLKNFNETVVEEAVLFLPEKLSVPLVLNVSIANYGQSLRANLLSSLGICTGDNAFANSSMFSTMIAANDELSSVIADNSSSVRWFTQGISGLNVALLQDYCQPRESSSFASYSLKYPLFFLESTNDPAVILAQATFNTNYVYQVQQLKPPFSLLVC